MLTAFQVQEPTVKSFGVRALPSSSTLGPAIATHPRVRRESVNPELTENLQKPLGTFTNLRSYESPTKVQRKSAENPSSHRLQPTISRVLMNEFYSPK